MTVRVVQAMRFGGPEVLVAAEAPDLVPGPGQVLIDVAVAPVLFLDTQIRRGAAQDWFPARPPYVPGAGVAGRVTSGGEGVDGRWVGRRVVADAGGGYASQAIVREEQLIEVPGGVDLPVAAALLHDGRTALGLADAAALSPGAWVLVLSAAGGLGILLVQLARAAGARVIGAARGKQKLDLATEMGAEVVVDYADPTWPELVRTATGGAGPGVVFDGAGGKLGQAAFGVIAPGGRLFAYGTPSGGFAEIDPHEAERRAVTVRGIELVQFAPEEGRRLTERALTEAAAGRITPLVGQTFPLERAADAHRAIEARDAVGKTLLLI
jgi:NADPH2:quinone reductase